MTDKKPRKKSVKKKTEKVVKLVKNKPPSEKQEWVTHQHVKLLKDAKCIVITQDKEGFVTTAYYGAMQSDIIFMCNALIHDILQDSYE